MLRHIVMWNLETKEEDISQVKDFIREEFLSLKDKINEIRDISVVFNENLTDKDRRDIALVVDLDNMESLARYAKDPRHIEVVNKVKEYLKNRTVIDFIVGD